MVRDIGLDAQAVADAVRLHTELGVKYRDALKSFDKSNSEAGKAADKLVRGVDRPLVAMLDAIGTTIDQKKSKLHTLAIEMNAQAFNVCRASQMKANELLDRLIKINDDCSKQSVRLADSDSQATAWMMVAAMIGGAVLLIVLGAFLAKSISKVLATLIGEAKRLSDAAIEGNLKVQGNPKLVGFEFRPIIDGLNETLEGFRAPIQDISQTLQRMADKDFSTPVATEYPGAYGELRDNVNLVVSSDPRRPSSRSPRAPASSPRARGSSPRARRRWPPARRSRVPASSR